MSTLDRSNQKNSATQPSSGRFWNDPDKRALFFQVLLVLGLAAFFLYIINNTLSNLEQRGITTGFAFLDVEAGFGILQSLIPYTETDSYGRTFLVGLLNTVLVSVMGIIAATLLGFFLGVGRLSKNWLVSKICTVYIEIFRNIPLLLQIFFWYFAVLRTLPSPRQSIEFLGSFINVRGIYMPEPVGTDGFNYVWIAFFLGIVATWLLKRWADKRQDDTGQDFPTLYAGLGLILGLPFVVFLIMGMPLEIDQPALKGFNFVGGMVLIPELMALWLALTIYTAAFIAEIVRGGILSVPNGQLEAASALGLPRGRTLRFIILPQALRVIIPPLTSQYLNLTKNSSLATAIGYPDLVSVFAGTTLNQTGQAIEVIFMTMAVYLTLSILTSIFMNWYNSRKALIER
ncbi:amino acid ABC transporter permease [Neptunomonas japonica]|uniref:General L-amino acid transport system permease protein n=1 Tax=Neptunomonas japonica JAMM 1380 TaxID=1441457 RepID=A0A7R6SWI2_9GAMM|nr:amino acid ABC transporter permease [Neptunomonas japonica]BBB30520.1 general L-amino acid transport system permease protein [Neptunomonas japonica JAMM 1380]